MSNNNQRERRGVRTGRHNAYTTVALLFELSDMTAIVPLPMTRLYFFTVWTNETLLAANPRGVDIVRGFWITGVGEMGLIGRGHRALLVGIEGGVAVATFCVLKGDTYAAVGMCEGRARRILGGGFVVRGGGGSCVAL